MSESSVSLNPLFSIGHSNHPIEAFLALLDQHAIDVVADVRSSPFSKFVPAYNQNQLKITLELRHKLYVSLGKELGGRPTGDDYYDVAGHVLYGRLAKADFFRAGLARLENGRRRYRIAILCSEEDPAVCHRHLLIGRVLSDEGTTLQHVRGDGSIESDVDVAVRSGTGAINRQPSFFGEAEDPRWRSIRSVLQKDPRESSLEL